MSELAGGASREKHIVAQLNRLNETINQLENWQSDYEVRLEAVTRYPQDQPKPETDPPNKVTATEQLVPLAETLREFNNRIRGVINRMESQLERLEL